MDADISLFNLSAVFLPDAFSSAIRANNRPIIQTIRESLLDVRISEMKLDHSDAKRNLVHFAVMKDADQVIQPLVEIRADVNGEDSDGQTPLHRALTTDALKNRLSIVRQLLECKADPRIWCKLEKVEWFHLKRRESPLRIALEKKEPAYK